MDLEEQKEMLELLHDCGIRYVRFTGGEPTVYTGLLPLAAYAKKQRWFEEMTLTTNGSRMQLLAEPLQKAGIDRVNISLDTVDKRRFAEMTGGGNLEEVLDGIAASCSAGYKAVKINTVLWKHTTEADLDGVLAYGKAMGCIVRFIEYMPFAGKAYGGMNFSQWSEWIQEKKGRYEEIEMAGGHGPARYVRFSDGMICGYIFPVSHQYCQDCNRIRITADGKLRLCLLQDGEIDIRRVLRLKKEERANALQALLLKKPKEYSHIGPMKQGMNTIGG